MANSTHSMDVSGAALLDAVLHSANPDTSKIREKPANKRKLETRRAIEDYLESKRMQRDLDEYYPND